MSQWIKWSRGISSYKTNKIRLDSQSWEKNLSVALKSAGKWQSLPTCWGRIMSRKFYVHSRACYVKSWKSSFKAALQSTICTSSITKMTMWMAPLSTVWALKTRDSFCTLNSITKSAVGLEWSSSSCITGAKITRARESTSNSCQLKMKRSRNS